MSDTSDEIARSWSANADAWTIAVRDGLIPSRRAGTDAAIVRAILQHMPERVLDVGCGEGWLLRALAEEGIGATGTDVSPELVAAARAAGSASAHVVSYAQMIDDDALVAGPWDLIVCNFSLLDEVLVPLLNALRDRLAPRGILLLQTVHPWSARGDRPYVDEWRTETFGAFPGRFPAQMPWFYRTMHSWLTALQRANLRVQQLEEPVHPETGAPLSLLLHAEAL